MSKKISWFFLLLFLMILSQACTPEKPLQVDTNVKATILVADTTGFYDSTQTSARVPVPNVEIILNSQEYIRQYRFFTNNQGLAEISGIVASNYEMNAVYSLPNGTLLLGGKSMPITTLSRQVDTVLLRPVSPTPLVINELYFMGPQNNIFFFYDQFIELFNGSDTTVFLDGKILARCRTSSEIRPIIELVDYVQTIYTYQFPGTPGGKEYPLLPGEYSVIASDAYNHMQTLSNAINLENADFEFYNEYRNDYDNPNVPNLVNINPNTSVDFYISLGSDAVILADGTSWELVVVGTSTGDKEYINIPISTIIDGVEYGSSSTAKGLTRRVDEGKGGEGMTKYSGKSIQRINPFQDTNNSTVDFRNLNTPTPGDE